MEYYYPRQALAGFAPADQQSRKLDKFKRRLRAVVYREWKLISYSDASAELFDLEHDPHEEKNLVNDPSAAAKLQELKAVLAKLEAEYGKVPAAQLSGAVPALDDATKEALRALGYMH